MNRKISEGYDPNFPENLKTVRDACAKANPELLSKRCEYCFPSKPVRYSIGCMCRQEGGELLRDIVLADVIFTFLILKNQPIKIQLFGKDEFILWQSDESYFSWKPNRTFYGQDPKDVAALAALLKRDD